MDYERIYSILNNWRESDYKVEYKFDDFWMTLHKDQPIRLLFEEEIRIVKKD